MKSSKKIPAEFGLKKEINADKYVLNGKMETWRGDFFEVFSVIKRPSQRGRDKIRLGKYPLMDSKTALEILENSYKAYNNGRGEWATMSNSKRVEYFKRFIIEFKKIREEVVKLLMLEIGKNLDDSRKEFDRTVKYIEETIEEIKNRTIFSNEFIEEGDVIGQIKRSPLGVTLCMGPYNYPLNESFTTIIPALMMGNTVVFKPPKRGVLMHFPILKIFHKCFPKGVFNIIYGEGEEVIKPIMESGKVSVLAFIGSSRAANIIQRYHPKPNRLKVILGLEAKNYAIILDDCNIDNAVRECILGSLSFNGQRCTALKLLYVHERIAKEFIEKFTKEVEKLEVGMPYENTFLTPIHEENLSHYKELVKDATQKGARIANRQKEPDFETNYYPKVLTGVNKHMKIYHEEQFGPIVPIKSFKSIDEPINSLIESNYGQQCSIFSKSSKRVSRMIDLLVNQVSRINLNSQCQRGPDSFPFTGRKDSAVETLSVSDALKAFSIKTLVSAKINDDNKEVFKKIVEKNESNFLKKEIIL